MCSTPKMPKLNDNPDPIQTPTAADASVTKASATTKDNSMMKANRNISTSSRGLLEDAQTKKKGLLGE